MPNNRLGSSSDVGALWDLPWKKTSVYWSMYPDRLCRMRTVRSSGRLSGGGGILLQGRSALGGCLLPVRGVCSGGCLLPGGLLGGVSALEGCLLWGQCVCSWGVSAPGGVCSQGVSALGGVCSGGLCIPPCTEADTPVDRQTPVKT